MDRKALNGVELAYEIAGSGDPLVLIHAGVCADFFAPLADEAVLAERFRVLRYHRPGYGGPGPATDLQAAFVREVAMPSIERYRGRDKAARSSSGCRGCAGRTTARRSSGRSRAPSSRPWPTPTRSWDRSCRR